MSATGLDVFDRTLQTTHIWLDELMQAIGPDRQVAWHVLGAVLRGVRDHIPLELAAHLGAQLPLLVRGTYYDQFRPSELPKTSRTLDEFLEGISAELANTRPVNVRDATRAVFQILSRHVNRGQIEKVRNSLPEEVRKALGRSPASPVLPCRVHAAGRDRRHRLPEQGRDLQLLAHDEALVLTVTARFLKRDLHRHRNGEHGVAWPSSTGHAMVGLGCVEQTLLIALAARALARRLFPSQGFADRTAEAIAARLDYDLTRFEADREMLRGLVERSLVLDDRLCRFLIRHPEAHVLSLGSGLSTQFERVDNGQLHWIDVDLPKVANLQRSLAPPHPRKRLVSASVTEFRLEFQTWASAWPDVRGGRGLADVPRARAGCSTGARPRQGALEWSG